MTSIFDFVRSEKPSQPIPEPTQQEQIEPQQEQPIPQEVPQKQMSPIFQQAQVKKKPLPQPIAQQPKPEEQQTIPFEGENELERSIESSQSRLTARGLETVGGLPGDIESFARWIIGNEKETLFPTSKELQQKTESLTGDRLKAKTDFDEKADELFKDIVSMAIPGSGQGSFVRNIGIPLVSFAAKEGVKKLGAGEEKQSYTKMGTMFLLDLLNTRRTMGMGGARNFASHLFNESESMIPQGATVQATNLQINVQAAIRALESGGTAPSTAKALTKLREIEGAVQNGRIPVRFLVDARKRINDIIESGGGFEFYVPRGTRNRSIQNLNRVKGQVIDTLQDYGQINPRFGAYNNAANEAYAAYAASNVVSNFVKKNFGDKIQNGTLKTILGLGTGGGIAAGLKFAPLASGAAITSIPVYHALKIAHRMFNSPTLRNYYNNIIRHSLQGNVAQTASNIKQLERALDKEEEVKEKRISELKKSSTADKNNKKNTHKP